MKNPFRKLRVIWIGWRGDLLSSGFRLNGGGYLYGAAPYRYWRIGPVIVKRYI